MRTLILSALMLVACAQKPMVPPAGTSPQAAKRDHYQCLQESQKVTALAAEGQMVLGTRTDRRLYRVCLESRGYTE